LAESLFSPSWYRVSKLKPRLRGHTRVYRHEYRGELWYVLQDHSKGRYYRFTPATYQVIGQMNGERTIQDLWDTASDHLGDDGPTQGEVIRLIGQLHSSDVLICDVPPDTAELLRRSEKIERAKWKQRLRSPLAMRFPLIDPERFLERTIGLVRPWFSIFGALLWLAIVGSAIVQASLHWPELTEGFIDRVLSAQNLLALYCVYPLVKAFHELGHGYAVKAWGGEVHEMGIMLLVFMPVPYVDASAASEFRSRHRRVLVDSAGILVEVLLASLALFLWLNLEPGTPRSLAYNVMLIGGISTVFFNGNPLLRYDGYYILSDLIDIPNLGQRGMNYLSYLFKRYAFRVKDAVPPYTGPGERFWFVFYSVTAFIYRMFIYVSIVLFIAGKFFFFGVLLAIWAAFNMVVNPIFKALKFLVSSPVLREKRPRAIGLSSAVLLVVILLLFVLPVPHRTITEGVIWVPEDAMVRIAVDGFVNTVVAEPNAWVERGELLIECEDPLLDTRVAVKRARLEELTSRYDAAIAIDQVQAQIIQRELETVRADMERAEERLDELSIRSPAAGRFILPIPQDLPGRYFRQGDLIAFVADVKQPTVRVVVPQSDVNLVRHQTRGIEVRLSEQLERIIPATLKREVPEAAERLPSTILGSIGGGVVAIDPTEESGTKTFEKLFQFDIELTESLDQIFIGGRVHVRFDHGPEPLAFRWYRAIRQTFLRRFNV
jgi:putative peptide zinc metalloprotease protein